jgi:hypothetical protein
MCLYADVLMALGLIGDTATIGKSAYQQIGTSVN